MEGIAVACLRDETIIIGDADTAAAVNETIIK